MAMTPLDRSTISALQRGRVPTKLLHAEVLSDDPWRQRLQTYLGSLRHHARDGHGLYIYGPKRSGKQRIAAIVFHQLARRNLVLWMETEGMREAHANRRLLYETDFPLWDRALDVTGLALIHFGEEQMTDAWRAGLHMLLRIRKQYGRPTYFTSYLLPKKVFDRYGEGVRNAVEDTSEPFSTLDGG